MSTDRPSPDWSDPGHDLPPSGTYRDLQAWMNSDGLVYVGNHALQVLPADEVTRLRDLITKAPHTEMCASTNPWQDPCDCWKRAALDDGERA